MTIYFYPQPYILALIINTFKFSFSQCFNFDTVFMILRNSDLNILNVYNELVHLPASQSTRSFPLQRLSPSETCSLASIYSFVADWICQFEQAKLGDWRQSGRVEGGCTEWNREEERERTIKKIVTDIHLTQAVEWEQSGLSNLCANSE